jgi:predicted Zn-dependent protease
MDRAVLQVARADLMTLLRERGARGESVAILRDLAGQELKELQVANSVAWYLATDPDPDVRRPARAVELVQVAVKKAPNVAAVWNTLGVALYRTGRWDEAIEALAHSARLTQGGTPHDWLFLAMAHWQKGDRAEGRAWYEKVLVWLDRNRPDDEELTRFRAEADALIQPRSSDNAMPSGADAFIH